MAGLDLWRAKVKSLVRNASLTERANTAFDVMGPADDRFRALVLLEERVQDNPKRAKFVEAIRKKREQSFQGVSDRFRNELYLQSILIFDWCSPKERQKHVIWVPVSISLMCSFFFFMAGAYPLHVLNEGYSTCKERWMVTPPGFFHWITFGDFWCLTPSAWTFDSVFLRQWGGRYNPFMRHQAYRWLTYAFLHTGFPHLLTNLLLWSTAGWHLEKRYGTSRLFAVWLVSSVLGDLFGAVCDRSAARCTVNVGFSAGLCGIVGLFLVDAVRNWRDTNRPLLRFSMFALLFLAFLATFFLQRGKVSNFSHLGGFLCGLFPSLLVQHHLGSENVDAYAGPVSLVATLFFLIFLPSWFYTHTYVESLDCV